MNLDMAARLLRALPAETAHRATLRLTGMFVPLLPKAPPDEARLGVKILGLDFPNPIGLAAGFDKDAEVPDAMLRLGFGFVECGTVTPRPQAGNPRPRLFRLPQDRAVINRMGFNNRGMAAAVGKLRARRGKRNRRHQYRRQQGQRRPYRRLRADFRDAGAVGRLCDGECLLAQHAGLRGLQNRDELTRLLTVLVELRAGKERKGLCC